MMVRLFMVFRAGCAITLALSGAELSEIMDHVGWTRRHTALHYLQLAKVLNPTGASARLSAIDIPAVTAGWNVSSVPFLLPQGSSVLNIAL